MTAPYTSTRRNIVAKWPTLAPYLLSILRIVAAFMFIQPGTMKIFAFPAGIPPNGGTVPLMSQLRLGGMMEVVGGALLLIGLFTRPVAFILAGEMAVAYFQFHFPQSFWTVLNNGQPAVLYCFIWLFISARARDRGAWTPGAANDWVRGHLTVALAHAICRWRRYAI